MRILKKDLKKGFVSIQVENLDDLWYLSHIIDLNDYIKGKTFRKIKLGGEQDRATKVVKKPMTLKLNVEKIEFSNTSDILRVSGKVTAGPDEVSIGSYHTFNLEQNTLVTIEKEKWLKFQIDKLNESAEQKTANILICIFDREHVTFAIMKKYGFEVLSEFTGNVQKKDSPEKTKEDFFPLILKTLEEYITRYKSPHVIVASPAFFKDNLMKLANDTLKKKVILATCNSTGNSGITEVLKRPEVNEVLKMERTSKELNLVEKLLSEISKENLACYGKKQTIIAAESGAVLDLLLTDKFISKEREKGSYDQIDSIMKLIDSMDGNIHIISSEHQGGKKLDGLGGMGGILRYKIN